ncbi:MAG: hypothetical protein AAB834_03960, partial [Patescibacteria group bacterium]
MIQREHFGWSAGRARLTGLFTSRRRTILAMVPVAIFAGFLAAVVPAIPVGAAPPTMSWVDDATIQVSGGDLAAGTYRVVTESNLNPSNGLAFSGKADVKHKDNCWVGFAIGVPTGSGGAQTNWSKAMVWISAPETNNPNCKATSADPKYDLGFVNGQLYTVANVQNRSNSGDPQAPPQVDDPAAQQVINVKLTTSWTTIYTT